MQVVFMDIYETSFKACQFKEVLLLLIFLCGSEDTKIKQLVVNNDHFLHIQKFNLIRASSNRASSPMSSSYVKWHFLWLYKNQKI